MLNRFRNAVVQAVSGEQPQNSKENRLQPKFQYSRPVFLGLNTAEELSVSADHRLRPIIVPRDPEALPWNSGYAECVNSGKSYFNEDQAMKKLSVLRKVVQLDDGTISSVEVPYVLFGLFDGHAGTGASSAAAAQFHHVLHEKLIDCSEDLDANTRDSLITNDRLIIGALETAFLEMDQLIAEDVVKYFMPGGCTALVMIMILGKVYVANAGDSRAVACLDSFRNVVPMSKDFTPESERVRIRNLAFHRPELLGDDFTHREYLKKPRRQDLGKRVLYRDPLMTGWAYKTLSFDDLKQPVVAGEGKRCRVMGTIGVTRGFGDHDLRALHTNVRVKPFLSALPEVKILDLDDHNLTPEDVIVLGTDGLWDVMSNERAAQLIQNSLKTFPTEKHRFVSAAQALVASARGRRHDDGSWRMSADTYASADDISAFVVPLCPFFNDNIDTKRALLSMDKFEQQQS